VTGFHLAQFNVARLAAPLDSPRLADFVAHLPEINGLADGWPGFVWRLTDADGGDATSLRADGLGEDVIVNLTVWATLDALTAYTYRSRHLDLLRRRREWFEPAAGPHLVCWWIPAGHRPTVAEGVDRLAQLERDGPGPAAFTPRAPEPAPA
jgi:hypothetical protein